jgi:hypothetical protein
MKELEHMIQWRNLKQLFLIVSKKSVAILAAIQLTINKTVFVYM